MKEFDRFLIGKPLEKITIDVPPGVKFLSQWTSFSLPKGHSIIDKAICGCGFTEYCLTNDQPIILCSPRKALIVNKELQHNFIKDEHGEWVFNPDAEFPVYCFKNEKEAILNYDSADSIEGEGEDSSSSQENQGYLRELKMQMLDWITEYNCKCYIKWRRNPNPKILVTYDSLKHVIDALGDKLFNYSVVVDEFQSIFVDAAFKSSVELDFVDLLKSYPQLNVTYVSATPMMDRYLGSINYFPSLPYYKLNWGSRAERVYVDWIPTKSLVTSCVDFINSYKAGIYPIKVDKNKEVRESREVVFFVNSVKTICDIIKKAGLRPEETSIVCADMAPNLKRIKKLGKGFDYGKIPTTPGFNKMFTFCTRTAYLGADFYSTNAYTVVCSDINVKTLNVDIALDLPQIVGRQRMEENIFRDEVKVLYVAKNKDDEITIEEFLAEDEKKEQESKELLSTASVAQAWVKKGSRDKEIYLHDYVGFKRDGTPEYNYLVKISFIRGFETSRKEYLENILVKKEEGDEVPDTLQFSSGVEMNKVVSDYIKEFKSNFKSDNNFERRIKLVCNILEEDKNKYELIRNLVPITYRNYIELFGVSAIKAAGYKEANLRNMMGDVKHTDSLKESILKVFSTGMKVSVNEIKLTLADIYSELGLTRTPKASDIKEFFKVKDCLVQNKETGKRDRGFEFLKLL